MTLPTTSRRALLGALPVTAAAVALPAAVQASPAVDRRVWNAAIRDLAKIEAEDAAFTPGWWEAWKQCKAECDSIPHAAFRPDPHTGRPSPVTTADQHFVARARKAVADVDAGKMRFDPDPSLQEHLQLCRDVASAADERDRQVQAIRDRYGMDAADARAEELGDLIANARERVMNTPAPDLAALRWKLGQFREGDGDVVAWSAEYAAQTFADIARLLPKAG